MRLQPLATRTEAIPLVARWLYEEWGHRREGNSYEGTCQRLTAAAANDGLPMYLLAVEGETVVGCGALKLREMETYPKREHWLGSVYVKPAWRGHGIASRLVEAVVAVSPRFGVSVLSLQTERPDGGLYAKLGWRPVERVWFHGTEVTVMERYLRNPAEPLSPNGGPAGWPGNSEVSGGAPSVT
jgi:GNAT superfamily N-acetyltransferase